MDDATLKLDTGSLLEVPCYEPDECGHNWLAVIEARDPGSPGGLKRRFQRRAGQPFYYLTEGLKIEMFSLTHDPRLENASSGQT